NRARPADQTSPKPPPHPYSAAPDPGPTPHPPCSPAAAPAPLKDQSPKPQPPADRNGREKLLLSRRFPLRPAPASLGTPRGRHSKRAFPPCSPPPQPNPQPASPA